MIHNTQKNEPELYDNTSMENFFVTLKSKCVYRTHFTTRAEFK